MARKSNTLRTVRKDTSQFQNSKALTTKPVVRSQFGKQYWKNWVQKKKWPKKLESLPLLRIVDLFCGCGGMTLGIIEAAAAEGYNCSIALAADTSPDASDIYQKNFGSILESYSQTNLSTLFPSEGLNTDINAIRERFGHIDILVAGPPCQGHSNLNNTTRRNDPRNQLYLSAITAAEVLCPDICIIENVATVIHDKTGVVQNARHRLAKAGYKVAEFVVRMDQMGLAQRRKRHVLVGTRHVSPEIADSLSCRSTSTANLRDYISDLTDEWKKSDMLFNTPSSMSEINLQRLNLLIENNLLDLPDSERPPCHKDKVHSYKSAYGRLSWNLPAQTITSGFGSMGQGRYVHPSEPRTITPHEAARLQGFPDFFDFASLKKRTKLQEIIANAVPPPAMATIVRALIKK